MKVFAACFIAFATALASHAGDTVKFIEMKDYVLRDSLPPTIEVQFSIACNQRFLRAIRHEETEIETGKVTISIGGIVLESSDECNDDDTQDLWFGVGHAYSGVEYEVLSIKNGNN